MHNYALIKIILLGAIAMLSLAVAIVLFVLLYQRKLASHQEQLTVINLQKEKELIEAAIHAEEEERTRIAAELHDDVGATLASVQLFLQVAEKEEGKEKIIQSQHLINDTINKVRSLSHRLQPAILLKSGLSAALESFFDVFNKSGAIHIEYTTEQLPDLDENTALSIYRIVQELLNNTLKHAAATRAELSIETTDNTLTLCYSHNGKGITEEMFQQYIYKKDATGLKNIINRLKVLNGSISFEKEPNWYHTIITVPTA
ncbi:MAG: hypothetical protein JST82_08115 [Bacteroidetes bacterium]|nr:hypothetical protein [Bacteroidota bacterium]